MQYLCENKKTEAEESTYVFACIKISLYGHTRNCQDLPTGELKDWGHEPEGTFPYRYPVVPLEF